MLQERQQQIANLGYQIILDHPSTRMIRTNCNLIAHAFIRQELWTATRINNRQRPLLDFGGRELIDCLTEQMQQWRGRTFILSAESFSYMRTRTERKHLSAYLAKFGFDVYPIVYIRDAQSWRASWEAQIAKQPGVRLFRQRYPSQFKILDDWYFDRDTLTAFWRSISQNTLFVDYDNEVAQRGSVIPSFLQAIGLPRSFDSERYFLNRTSRAGSIETPIEPR
jgi:hypothetical protein